MSIFPEPSKRRMIMLFGLLENWEKPRITSLEIGKCLGCKDSLIRHDFSFLGIKCGVSNGYEVSALRQTLETALGFPRLHEDDGIAKKKCCIVGLGRLGAALLDDGIFEGSGFSVVAGFDSSLNRVELMRSVFELYPASRIESVIPERKIDYAILCCAESEAEKMVLRLVNAGIKGIVNCTRSVFAVPENVKVINASPIVALLSL